MLSKSWQWLACILQPAEHHPSPIELATIHATILAILMGVLSAYFIYIYGEIRSARSEVMRGAEEINKIVFRRSSYHPSDEDVYQVTGPEDMDRLKKSLWKLMYLSPNEVIPPDPEEVAAVPEEPSKRAKRFLEILNVVIHQYPFPRAIEVTSKG